MSTAQLAQYANWTGWLTAGVAWALALSMITPRIRRLFGNSYWLLLAWLVHVGLFFMTIRAARLLGAPIPAYAGNVWSTIVYLQALFSVAAYIVLCHRYRPTSRS